MASVNGIRVGLYVVLVCRVSWTMQTTLILPGRAPPTVALFRCPPWPYGHPPPLHPFPPAVRPTEQRQAVLRPHRRGAPRHLRPRALLVVLHVRYRGAWRVMGPAVCSAPLTIAAAYDSIHIIHRSYDYGRFSSFAAELLGLMSLFTLFLVGAVIASVRSVFLFRLELHSPPNSISPHHGLPDSRESELTPIPRRLSGATCPSATRTGSAAC